ncbi:MAG: His-Xaa-Ser system protein HxsD [Planctomycetales bacterium]|nr:His-Xaa-Ser system protein HxsD [Planctomycetales bacterium]
MSQLLVEFDQKVFRLTAVKKAAYRFGNQWFVEITTPANDRVLVTLTAKSSSVSSEGVEGDFRNEVLDQELRESVAEETERVRNLLLAQAFSGMSLTDAVGESADHRVDPLGIARSQISE